jgi:hypothetical protein
VIYVDRKFVSDLSADETAARIAVLKNRDGRVGVMDATFNIQTLRFEAPLDPVQDRRTSCKNLETAGARIN